MTSLSTLPAESFPSYGELPPAPGFQRLTEADLLSSQQAANEELRARVVRTDWLVTKYLVTSSLPDGNNQRIDPRYFDGDPAWSQIRADPVALQQALYDLATSIFWHVDNWATLSASGGADGSSYEAAAVQRHAQELKVSGSLGKFVGLCVEAIVAAGLGSQPFSREVTAGALVAIKRLLSQ